MERHAESWTIHVNHHQVMIVGKPSPRAAEFQGFSFLITSDCPVAAIMQKRSWTEMSGSDRVSSLPSRVTTHGPNNTEDTSEISTIGSSRAENQGSSAPAVPTLSRKIKACAACRKQKIKCLMDGGAPPCRRCTKHQLDCIVSKNLQTIIDEKARYTDAIFEDLSHLHTLLREVSQKVGLQEPRILRTSLLRNAAESPGSGHHNIIEDLGDEPQRNDDGPSRDRSPEIALEEDTSLPRVPIQSLYTLTKWKPLRPPGVLEDQPSPSARDLIGNGEINNGEAERLFSVYRDRLDAFIYGIGCPYRSLKETRIKSPILATTILAVSALHDEKSDDTYSVCSAELRRLVSLAIFDRTTSRDFLRAMCVASYWLSDISWIVSGHAIRRASECALHNQHIEAVQEESSEAADGARLWFILRVCDQRLATLYGRPAIMNEDPSIHEIESFLQSPISNDQDKRLIGQVALLGIFKNIRELFGPDNGQPIHRAYLHQIAHFNKQLDGWYKHWSSTVAETYMGIGSFPRKAVQLHFQFAKLHLNSHVFRGLSSGEPIPHYYLDCANQAVSAAISTIDFMLSDPTVTDVVVGIPSYLHCMTAFACMFLIKVALKYGAHLIEPSYVWNPTTRLVQNFLSMPAGSWHLTKLMAPGLERMASMLDPAKEAQLPNMADGIWDAFNQQGVSSSNSRGVEANGAFMGFEGDFFFDYNINLGLSPPAEFS